MRGRFVGDFGSFSGENRHLETISEKFQVSEAKGAIPVVFFQPLEVGKEPSMRLTPNLTHSNNSPNKTNLN